MLTRASSEGRAYMKINMNYIARVEGEATVKLDISDGELKDLKLNIWEPPRFFEGFLRGRKFDEAPDIVSRICGICPVSHMVTSIRAVEKAFGFLPTEEIARIREIMSLSQIASSHIVHLYVLALPDYHRLPAIVGMDTEIARLVRLKTVLNKLTAVFGGRALHPVAMVVGGFTDVPDRGDVTDLIRLLEDIRTDVLDTVRMIAGLDLPELRTDHEYVALRKGDGYGIEEGKIISSRGISLNEDDYPDAFEEREVPYANAKRTVIKGSGSMMVGALARLNLNMGSLHPEARAIAEEVGFSLPASNPYLNNLAQAIETVHCFHQCIELLDQVTGKDAFFPVTIKEGFGSAVTEAPRGLLCHQYRINRRGVIDEANVITPTAHNFLSLEEALRKLVAENISLPQDELTLRCEMLVRAYDPCFSCSVH
jgi:sulfhydrogenase subunit alpha